MPVSSRSASRRSKKVRPESEEEMMKDLMSSRSGRGRDKVAER